jgi:hypothetical protein
MKANTIELLFGKRKAALELFQQVQNYIESLGDIKTTVTKTQVSFGTNRKFAWVWLPQMWIKKQSEDSIVLTFALDHLVDDERIKEAVEPSPGRWTHHVVIQEKSDFDENVRAWILEAWKISLRSSG